MARITQEIESTIDLKKRSVEALKSDFLFFNDQKKLDNKARKEVEDK
jgi:hypothetical protein